MKNAPVLSSPHEEKTTTEKKGHTCTIYNPKTTTEMSAYSSISDPDSPSFTPEQAKYINAKLDQALLQERQVWYNLGYEDGQKKKLQEH